MAVEGGKGHVIFTANMVKTGIRAVRRRKRKRGGGTRR